MVFDVSITAYVAKKILISRILPTILQVREKSLLSNTRLKNPYWFLKQKRSTNFDFITPQNKKFIQDMMKIDFNCGIAKKQCSILESSLKNIVKISNLEKYDYDLGKITKRTGVLAKKIGQYPLWLKNGKKTRTTLLQILDNHVIKYISKRVMLTRNGNVHQDTFKELNKFGYFLIGAENIEPLELTKEYYGLFKNPDVIPKKHLARFIVSPLSAVSDDIVLKTPHFNVGDFIDIRGKTIDRGFQGVVDRWGFRGMPATHGVTKTHRRPGNIGGGGEKGRVWPGTKMPGNMGNKWRTVRGLQILRMNTKYNVIWVNGSCIAGKTNSLVYIYDTILPSKLSKLTTCTPHDLLQDNSVEQLPEEWYFEEIHDFKKPIMQEKNIVE